MSAGGGGFESSSIGVIFGLSLGVMGPNIGLESGVINFL